jgi:carboxyl-terminal processing protease
MKRKKSINIAFFFIVFFVGFLLIPSCSKDDEDTDVKPENIAFYNLMQEWYYWNDQLPAINLSDYKTPYEVLEALRHRPLDRWSYITSLRELQEYFSQSRFIGYGFGSRWDHNGELRVTFVFEQTAMYNNGVRRSWVIEAINGTNLTAGANINPMLGQSEVGVSNSFRFRKPDGSKVELTVQKQEVTMNNVLHADVIEQSSKKIGYLVVQGFTEPTLIELESVFGHFVNEGIDELILDMRYNSGGQDIIANALASMIGGQKVAGKTYSKYEFNATKTSENFTRAFVNVELKLNINRLITITTQQTASASEAIINNLMPYMPVYVIGQNTYGKPMGMQVWSYQEYAFVPIMFKINNADDEGDYFDGISVDFAAGDDLTLMFGDPEEASLKQALYFIETGGVIAKAMPYETISYKQPWEYMTGIRAQVGAH